MRFRGGLTIEQRGQQEEAVLLIAVNGLETYWILPTNTCFCGVAGEYPDYKFELYGFFSRGVAE
jgi:hypothetical protein